MTDPYGAHTGREGNFLLDWKEARFMICLSLNTKKVFLKSMRRFWKILGSVPLVRSSFWPKFQFQVILSTSVSFGSSSEVYYGIQGQNEERTKGTLSKIFQQGRIDFIKTFFLVWFK